MVSSSRTFVAGPSNNLPILQDPEPVRHMQEAIAQGAHWFVAVLEAIGLWTAPEEVRNGRHYRYLIGGEAFDWLLLAERLCEDLADVAAAEEVEALLFHGQFPIDLEPWEFQRLLGRAKYRGHLNYWYGVMVEQGLLLAVEERLSKERHANGFVRGARESVYEWVYGVGLPDLLAGFWEERGRPPAADLSLGEWQEFTYWCFKYRLNHRDPAKVASDTRLGLERLHRIRPRRGSYNRMAPAFPP